MTTVRAVREQTRARHPDQEGYVERDGCACSGSATARRADLPATRGFAETDDVPSDQ
jgi:hypothetical protein